MKNKPPLCESKLKNNLNRGKYPELEIIDPNKKLSEKEKRTTRIIPDININKLKNKKGLPDIFNGKPWQGNKKNLTKNQQLPKLNLKETKISEAIFPIFAMKGTILKDKIDRLIQNNENIIDPFYFNKNSILYKNAVGKNKKPIVSRQLKPIKIDDNNNQKKINLEDQELFNFETFGKKNLGKFKEIHSFGKQRNLQNEQKLQPLLQNNQQIQLQKPPLPMNFIMSKKLKEIKQIRETTTKREYNKQRYIDSFQNEIINKGGILSPIIIK